MSAPGAHGGRRVLCVFPRYTPSFGSFEFSYPLTDGVRAFMPPQGLLVIAAVLPPSWQVRFIDENIDAGHATTISPGPTWCSSAACMCSAGQMEDIRRRAHALDRSRCWAARRCRPARNTTRTSTICMSASWATPPTS